MFSVLSMILLFSLYSLLDHGFTGIGLEDHLDEDPPRDLDMVRRDAATGTLNAAFVWLGMLVLSFTCLFVDRYQRKQQLRHNPLEEFR